ncbi:tetraacyldisaccharide 4'-kinase [Vibrio sp. MACH09]|uniref:tetraacyldisaccharide 4'-kinase n=1 Tax=Vibrio sp. MACH09 TaxID=3025122 RepID=UPI002791A501|nr:tetraacyldisaccharide 4'-kinase [Vibrio sp. MACH09]GLO61271.1 tetraacyldisaccharide 4'-kinase [Vibrio sp. MACH09]
MVEKIWFENHFLSWLLWPLLWPLSQIFKRISLYRRKQFLLNSDHAFRADVPVVVVGNITAGGNGKTPVVIWLVEQLQKQGLKPGVVSRGYGAKADQYPLVVDASTSTKACGDEPKLIFERTKAPVAVDPKRANAVKALVAQGVDIIITDDGLQHYALDRDIELIVVDGARRFGNQAYIPLGPLREGTERLASVDFVITNGGTAEKGEMPMSLQPGLAVNLVTGEKISVTELEKLVAFAAIGHPPRFFNTLNSMGAELIKSQGFPDHKDVELAEIEALERIGKHVIMTEKDAVKCVGFAKRNWWYLPVSACFTDADQQQIIKKILDVRKEYGSPST